MTCPLCQLADPENIVREGKHWIVKRNVNPYRGLRHHVLLALRKHTASPDSLKDAAKVEYFDHIAWVMREFEVPGCGVVMRLGDPAFHGGSIPEHLHGHIMVPDGTVPIETIFYKAR